MSFCTFTIVHALKQTFLWFATLRSWRNVHADVFVCAYRRTKNKRNVNTLYSNSRSASLFRKFIFFSNNVVMCATDHIVWLEKRLQRQIIKSRALDSLVAISLTREQKRKKRWQFKMKSGKKKGKKTIKKN